MSIYHIECNNDLSKWAVIKFELEDADVDAEELALNMIIGKEWFIIRISDDWRYGNKCGKT